MPSRDPPDQRWCGSTPRRSHILQEEVLFETDENVGSRKLVHSFMRILGRKYYVK